MIALEQRINNYVMVVIGGGQQEMLL